MVLWGWHINLGESPHCGTHLWWDQREKHLIHPHVRQVHRMRHEMTPEGHLAEGRSERRKMKKWEGPEIFWGTTEAEMMCKWCKCWKMMIF